MSLPYVTPPEFVAALLHDLDEDPTMWRGYPTGFQGLDAMFGGLRPGALTTVGALPHHGKTSFLTQLAIGLRAATPGLAVLLFSLETPRDRLGELLIPQFYAFLEETNVTGLQAFSALWPDLTATWVETYHRWPPERRGLFHQFLTTHGPTYFPFGRYTEGYTLAHLQDTIGAFRTNEPTTPFVIMVDHLLRLECTTKRDQHEFLRQACTTLRELGANFDAPVLLATQLNRDFEKAKDSAVAGGIPSGFHLQASSAIEQVSDLVCTITRFDRLTHADDKPSLDAYHAFRNSLSHLCPTHEETSQYHQAAGQLAILKNRFGTSHRVINFLFDETHRYFYFDPAPTP